MPDLPTGYAPVPIINTPETVRSRPTPLGRAVDSGPGEPCSTAR